MSSVDLIQPNRSYWSLLHRYLGPRRGPVALLSMMLLAGIALQVAKPQLVRLFLDQTQSAAAGPGGGTGAVLYPLPWLAAAFMLMAVAERGLQMGGAYLGTWLGWDAANSLRSDLASHCLHLPMAFHAAHTSGELIERIDGDVSALGGFMFELFLRLLANGLLAATVIVIMLAQDWRLGVGFLLYALLTITALGAVSRWGRAIWGRSRAARAALTSCTEELLTSREDLQSSGAVDYADSRLAAAIHGNLIRWRAAALTGAATSGVNRLLQSAGLVIGLGIAAWLYFRGSASIGTAYLVVSYAGLLAGPLDAVRRQLTELQSASASAGRALSLLAEPGREDRASGGTSALPSGPLGVRCREVGFHYETGSHEALAGISLAVQPGETVGLVGRTGSGKTTLARLMLGLYTPVTGQIEIAGQPLQEIPLTELRRRVGLVTQDVQLLQGTVRDNIALYDPAVTDETLLSLLTDIGLADWLASLPDGLDTRLGPGSGLSAGEAQLLSIARLLLRDPGLVVLDEAAARLDPATEDLLSRALDRLLPRRTVILVAHRLRTMERVDRLLVMSGGRVVEEGTPAELAERPGSAYAHLRAAGGLAEVGA